jgi:hypothetical protein
MRSDKLFYLVFTLSHQLADGKLSYHQVREKLSRPDVLKRISTHQLLYMVQDYVESMETPRQPPQTLLLLTGECALLGQKKKIVQIVAQLIANMPSVKYVAEHIYFLTRAGDCLDESGLGVGEIRNAVFDLNARTRPVADDDF